MLIAVTTVTVPEFVALAVLCFTSGRKHPRPTALARTLPGSSLLTPSVRAKARVCSRASCAAQRAGCKRKRSRIRAGQGCPARLSERTPRAWCPVATMSTARVRRTQPLCSSGRKEAQRGGQHDHDAEGNDQRHHGEVLVRLPVRQPADHQHRDDGAVVRQRVETAG